MLVIAGPTAVGKTGIALAVAQNLDTAIVSADSRQCYMGMAIGTAQPSAAELAAVKHFFINEFPVSTALNAADYEKLALGYLETIFKDRDTAVVCGGTGLYLKALCDGLDDMPAVDPSIATSINEQYKQLGFEWLSAQVQTQDPSFFAQGDVLNPARLLRALIFKLSTGESILNYQSARKKERPFRMVKVGLALPRDYLYSRINERVDDMMKLGFLEEAKALFPMRHLKNLQTVGYEELFDYLAGNIPLPKAVDLIKQHTRNYAKRQLTWFKKDTTIQWFNADDTQVASKIIELLT